MAGSTRKQIIEDYYRIIDDEDYDALASVFAPDVAFIRPGEDAIQGRDRLAEYLRTERRSTNTTHDVVRFAEVGANGMFAKVAVSGKLPTGSYDGDIVGEFAFDDETNLISTYRVYRGYERE